MNTPTLNSQHFPDDTAWQKHCRMLAAYRAAQLEVVAVAPSVAGKLDVFEPIGRAA